jgi:hypothetical protein
VGLLDHLTSDTGVFSIVISSAHYLAFNDVVNPRLKLFDVLFTQARVRVETVTLPPCLLFRTVDVHLPWIFSNLFNGVKD